MIRRMHPNRGKIVELDVDEDVTLVDAEEDMNADDTDEAELAELEEVIEVVTAANLMTKVVTTAATTTVATASVIMHTEVKSKDKGKGILVKEPKPLKRHVKLKQDEAFARQLEANKEYGKEYGKDGKRTSAFLYGTIEEEVYVCQPLGFKDPDYPDKVYKVAKALYRLHQALRAWYMTLASYLLKNGFQKGKTDQTLFIKKKKASTLIDTEKPLLKDPDGEDVDVHIYRHFRNAVSSKLMLFGLTIDATHLMLLGHKMVNPTIYVLCTMQFWTSVSIKKSNDVVRLQALIDWKKVIITKDTITQALRLDDVAGVDCLPNKEIFAMLARMGYEKLGLSGINLVLPWLQLSSALPQIGKGFSGVDTPLFDGMLVQQQVQAIEDAAKDENDDNEVSAKPTPPSPTPATPPPSPTKEYIPSPPQSKTAQPSSPPSQQPLQTTDISQSTMTLLNTLLETCATLTKQHKGLNPQLTLLWMIRRMHPNREKIAELDADEDVTLVDAEEDMNANDIDEAKPAEVKEVIEVVTAAKLMTKVVTTAATTTIGTTITVAQVLKASALRRRGCSHTLGTPSTGSGNLYCQWELSHGSGNALCILFPTNLFSVGQFCDSDLEVAFRRNACFIRNLEGVDLLSVNRTTNLYTINLHEMASASPIFLMARPSSTKSWLWHQRLSHLNFDTINDLAKNDLVSGLLKFKYHKEHLCPLCEQGKSKRASHPPKPVPNFNKRLRILHKDLCGPMRIPSINGKWHVLVIMDDYSCYTWFKTQATEGELDLLFEAMYDDYIGGQPSATPRTVLAAQDVDGLNSQQQHAQEQVSTIEPKNVKEAMTDPAWIESMQEELLQFKKLNVWVLVPAPDNITPLTLKWLFKNKHDEEKMVIRKKSCLVALYGLKQAPRAWYDELSTFLLNNHFFKGTTDPTLFIRRSVDDILVVQVYVYDIIFSSTHPRYTQLFSDLMKSHFEMSMMREMTFFLGLQVNQSPCGIFINQSNYVLEILTKYGMESCDPVGTPMEIKDKLDLDQTGTPVDAMKYRSMIGALMYLTSSRPDIVYATCLCLWYTKDFGFELTGFLDADYAGCKDTFKSTFGGAQFLGEKLVSWSSKKQNCTALSTAKAEYVSLSACCAQVLWMRTQLMDYGFHFNKIPIYCDLKSAIAISCKPVQLSRTKHIAVRYHFIKEHGEKGTIELYFVKTDYQLADLFTKALPVDRFNYLVRRLGMRSLSPQELDCLAKSQ
uniref:Retrotransposon protein, putative, unclassified n=1 Tax=Tanacetum cinerariifolium TaxID=118510 RepID=A0A6L2P5S1_TANCI|nr:retrotransposon protein, putative, unclassified [Tanacetum cinerariifolium]